MSELKNFENDQSIENIKSIFNKWRIPIEDFDKNQVISFFNIDEQFSYPNILRKSKYWNDPVIDKLSWNEKYDLLIEFYNEYKRQIMPSETYKNINLGDWYKNQRQRWQLDNLIPENKVKIEKMPFWNAPCKKLSWNEKYDLETEFENKHKRMSKFNEIYKNEKIGGWLQRQKRHWNKNKLSNAKKELLQKLPYWIPPVKHNKELSWNDKYLLLLEYQNLYKKNPKLNEKYKNLNLGYWNRDQKYKFSDLSTEKQKLLLKLPYWNVNDKMVKENNKWNEKYNLLLKYEKEFNKRIVRGTKYMEINLGDWYKTQRDQAKNNTLKNDRRKLMEKTKFWNL